MEQRINFPDYTAENQERDAQRYLEKQKKDVYVVKTKGVYGVYFPTTKIPLSSHSEQGESFTKFITDVKEFCEEILKIKPKFHCVINKGIEDHIFQQMITKKLIEK